MDAAKEMPPVGHYLAREAGSLAGVSGDKIGQWARRGYIRSSQRTHVPRVYSFQDVAEAMVIPVCPPALLPPYPPITAGHRLRHMTEAGDARAAVRPVGSSPLCVPTAPRESQNAENMTR